MGARMGVRMSTQLNAQLKDQPHFQNETYTISIATHPRFYPSGAACPQRH